MFANQLDHHDVGHDTRRRQVADDVFVAKLHQDGPSLLVHRRFIGHETLNGPRIITQLRIP